MLLNRFLNLCNGTYERRTSKVCENVKSYTPSIEICLVIPTFYLLLFILSPFVEIYVVQIIFPFHVIDWKRTFAHVKQIMASLLCCYVTTLTTGISGEFGTSVVNLWYTKFGPTQKKKQTNKQKKKRCWRHSEIRTETNELWGLSST